MIGGGGGVKVSDVEKMSDVGAKVRERTELEDRNLRKNVRG